MGYLINVNTFNVTRETLLEGYIYLKTIALIGSSIPFLYMWYFIPTKQQAMEIQEKNSRRSSAG